MSSYTRKQLEDWIKTKKVSGRVLDIGGSQLPIKGRIQAEKGTEFLVLDLEKPHEEKVKSDFVYDLNDEIVASLDNRLFDYAICLEVSEYWYDPFTALRNISGWFLKKGGTLFISFHFTYPVHNPINQDYLRYTRAGAIKLLEKAGFEIVQVKGRKAEDPIQLGAFHAGEGMRPARGYDFHGDVGCLIEARKK